jgi:hypothetical protein
MDAILKRSVEITAYYHGFIKKEEHNIVLKIFRDAQGSMKMLYLQENRSMSDKKGGERLKMIELEAGQNLEMKTYPSSDQKWEHSTTNTYRSNDSFYENDMFQIFESFVISSPFAKLKVLNMSTYKNMDDELYTIEKYVKQHKSQTHKPNILNLIVSNKKNWTAVQHPRKWWHIGGTNATDTSTCVPVKTDEVAISNNGVSRVVHMCARKKVVKYENEWISVSDFKRNS